jgi:hypothetical protein
MPRRLLLILIALGLTMAVTAAPVSAGALGTLDQQQTNSNNAHAVAGALQPAQVFTAGLTGQLDHVDLHLVVSDDEGGPGADLTVEIWTVTSGAPTSLVPGASATVLEADVPNAPTWVQVPISAPSVAGTQYAIVLAAPAASLGDCPSDCWQWLTDDSGPYAGGLSYFSGDGGTNWTAQARDFAFRTYVTVPAAPTPAASLLNAATADPESGSPLVALGFGALLIGSLGALALASARGAFRLG